MIKGINVITDRRDPDKQETFIETTNRWFSLAKNLAWIIGIVTIAVYYISNNNNINALQDDKIQKAQQDLKTVQADISTIKGSQTDQLVMLTKLLTIAERTNPVYSPIKKD